MKKILKTLETGFGFVAQSLTDDFPNRDFLQPEAVFGEIVLREISFGTITFGEITFVKVALATSEFRSR